MSRTYSEVKCLVLNCELCAKWKALDEVEESKDETNPKDLLGIKKPQLSLLPPAGIIHGALAMTNGAMKYGPYNFRDKKIQYMIYIDAMLRHLMALLDGEDIAEDSGVHHLGHINANTAILLDAIENGNIIDNRPKKGNASEILKRNSKDA